MIKKMIVCTENPEFFTNLKAIINNVPVLTTVLVDESIFFHNLEFDVINTPTSLMEEFNSKPMENDCQIIATKNKYGLPNYVVTSPNFGFQPNLTKTEMGFAQLETPLKKVQEFFKNSEITYAIHTEYSFAYFDKDNIPYEEIINRLTVILNQQEKN